MRGDRLVSDEAPPAPAWHFLLFENCCLLAGLTREIALMAVFLHAPWGNLLFGAALLLRAVFSTPAIAQLLGLAEEAHKWLVRRR